MTAAKLDQTLAQHAVRRVSELDSSGLLDEVTTPTTTISHHPLFQQELRHASAYKLTGSTKLAD